MNLSSEESVVFSLPPLSRRPRLSPEPGPEGQVPPLATPPLPPPSLPAGTYQLSPASPVPSCSLQFANEIPVSFVIVF